MTLWHFRVWELQLFGERDQGALIFVVEGALFGLRLLHSIQQVLQAALFAWSCLRAVET